MTTDHLIVSIKNLTDREFLRLQKELKTNPRKLTLLNYIREHDIKDYEDVIHALEYNENRNSFYALKHRLLKDLVDYKLEAGKTDIVKTKERIENLRILLFSRDQQLLEKELKDTTQRCEEYDIYHGLYEVNFIWYLLNFENKKLKNKYFKQMRDAQLKLINYMKLEYLFFKIIFEMDSTFFFPRVGDVEKENFKALDEIVYLHRKINSRGSELLWLISELSLRLKYVLRFKKIDKNIQSKMDRLSELYLDKFAKYYFPNHDFILACLFNKYYICINNYGNFYDSLDDMDKLAENIKGKKLFGEFYLYYIFAKVFALIHQKEYQQIIPVLSEELDNRLFESSSDKMKYYFYHYFSLGHMYAGNFKKAVSNLLMTRQFKKFISRSSNWMIIENSVLTIFCYLMSDEFKSLEYENNLLRKNLKKFNLYNKTWKSFLGEVDRIVPDDHKKIVEFAKLTDNLGAKYDFMFLFHFQFLAEN